MIYTHSTSKPWPIDLTDCQTSQLIIFMSVLPQPQFHKSNYKALLSTSDPSKKETQTPQHSIQIASWPPADGLPVIMSNRNQIELNCCGHCTDEKSLLESDPHTPCCPDCSFLKGPPTHQIPRIIPEDSFIILFQLNAFLLFCCHIHHYCCILQFMWKFDTLMKHMTLSNVTKYYCTVLL